MYQNIYYDKRCSFPHCENSLHFFSIYNFIYRIIGTCLLGRTPTKGIDSICSCYLLSICVILNIVWLSIDFISIGLYTAKEAADGKVSWFMRCVLGFCHIEVVYLALVCTQVNEAHPGKSRKAKRNGFLFSCCSTEIGHWVGKAH